MVVAFITAHGLFAAFIFIVFRSVWKPVPDILSVNPWLPAIWVEIELINGIVMNW